jgi:hypothetical protein
VKRVKLGSPRFKEEDPSSIFGTLGVVRGLGSVSPCGGAHQGGHVRALGWRVS